MSPSLVNLIYLIAATLFIFGLKNLSHPKTAVRGNLLGALGMLLAVVVTLLDKSIVSFEVILAGLIVGTGAGVVLAVKTPMTGMPQMVGLLNGFGGIASALVAGAALLEALHVETGAEGAAATVAKELGVTGSGIGLQFAIATAASGLIGGVTFWGSLVASGKLQGVISEKPFVFRGHNLVKAVLMLAVLVLAVVFVVERDQPYLYLTLALVASVLGFALVLPIGGADMPVVICLLNSYSGLAGAATGFVLNNSVLIVAGSLVGASGLILTHIMCKAMNRSFMNVMLGGFGAVVEGAKADDVYAGKVKSTSPEEVAMILDGARRVVIAPGYGMAVAQCQHAIRDLTNLLENRGTEVEFAIHPVAGRMPGHMNVLLAEANISYDKLKEMDEINPSFEQTDVAIVIGANDVVNPIARTDPSSPIAGMPILDVDKAKTVVVIKRSLSPGFAGIPNPLFAADNCLMLFGDGKKAVLGLIGALKES